MSSDGSGITVTIMSKSPVFKPFTLALVQLGNVGADKSANLKHAREMIRKAAGRQGKKPDVIVLPVRRPLRISRFAASSTHHRNALTLPTAICISQCMRRTLAIPLESGTICRRARVRASRCSHPPRKRLAHGLLEVRCSCLDFKLQPLSIHRLHT